MGRAALSSKATEGRGAVQEKGGKGSSGASAPCGLYSLSPSLLTPVRLTLEDCGRGPAGTSVMWDAVGRAVYTPVHL